MERETGFEPATLALARQFSPITTDPVFRILFIYSYLTPSHISDIFYKNPRFQRSLSTNLAQQSREASWTLSGNPSIRSSNSKKRTRNSSWPPADDGSLVTLYIPTNLASSIGDGQAFLSKDLKVGITLSCRHIDTGSYLCNPIETNPEAIKKDLSTEHKLVYK